MNPKIVVAGHVCVDLTPVIPHQAVEKIDQILIPGKLINTDGLSVSAGGVVSNTGLALKKLGANAELMGKIGEDFLGDLLLDIFRRYGCEQGMIRSKDSATSYTLVLAIPGLDRIFLHDPASNDSFCYDDLNFEHIRDAAIFHFGYPPLMKRIYQNNGEELIRIFKKIKEFGVATSLDMAAIDPNSDAAKEDWQKLIQEVIPYVDFFLPSMEELCSMINPPLFTEWTRRSKGKDLTEVISPKEVEPLADQLLSWGAKAVLIKCGAPGILLKTGSVSQIRQIGGNLITDPDEWANLSHFEMSYRPEKILSGTGAGDTCNAAFLLSVCRGYPWRRCLQLAAGTGASCVEGYDSLSGLRSFEELEKKIDNGWQKVEWIH
ncbi:MAG TPA: carbohydrate kinase family protein [Flexilinea sp.]|nr:carbohydrate kinase family protein [Flexilinea sp.]